MADGAHGQETGRTRTSAPAWPGCSTACDDSGGGRLPSPVRYYVPALPALVGGSVAAAVAGRHSASRTALATAALSTVAGVGLTAYVVRTVILRLIDDGPPLEQAERERLITRWHRVNRVRLVLAAVAAVAYDRAAHRGR